MTNVINNVMDYKVVADNGFQFNVNVYGVNNFGNRKWMLRAVEVIRDYFTFDDDADEGLIVNVIVNTHEIIVKAEFNGKKYWAYPIHPKFGKKQIREMLSNMGVVADVMAVFTNNMVNSNNNMEENDMVDMVNEIGFFNVYVKDVLLNEYNDAVESAEDFAQEYGDTFVEQMYLMGGMNYDYDIRKMWAEFCFENGLMNADDAYKYYDENRDMFIDEDDLDEIVECFDGTEDVGDGSCLLWVKNPYYVEQEQVNNDSPCLDDEWNDRDSLINITADVIKDYVDNYEGMLMDYDGNSASICVPWDEFSEDIMKNMIEDDVFAMQVEWLVYGVDGIKDMLVYDDGVYVSVDVKKYDNVA